MEIKNIKPKSLFWGTAILITFYWALHNFSLVGVVLTFIYTVLSPFIVGIVIAFLINLPMRAIEKLLFKNATDKMKKAARPISMVVTILLVLIAFSSFMLLVAPQLWSSVVSLGNSVEPAINDLTAWINQLSVQYPEIAVYLGEMDLNWQTIINEAISIVQTGVSAILGSLVTVVGSLFNTTMTFILALIFSLYLLAIKESLAERTDRLFATFVSRPKIEKATKILSLVHDTFAKFISGQCTEALINIVMFFIALTVLGFPHALLNSFIIGIASIIPYFGGFIGFGIAAFLVLVEDPSVIIWFAAVYLVLQLFEANVIYPKVVGSSMGLPPMWVLVCVTLGSNLMGLVGMVLFIPLGAVIYTLVWERVKRAENLNTNFLGKPSPIVAGTPTEDDESIIDIEN